MKKVTKKSVSTENNIPVLLAIFGLFVLMLLALVWKKSLDNRSDAAGPVDRSTRNSGSGRRVEEKIEPNDRKIDVKKPTAIPTKKGSIRK